MKDKIAQIIFQKYEEIEFEKVEKISETIRNENGFGSTNKFL